MKKEVILIKSFTTDPTQGNPTGIVLDADDLSDQQMQAIAKELGFAESAFIQSSSLANYRTRFFSPNQEVDLCGYATIASFHALRESGKVGKNKSQKIEVIQETKAGVLPIVGMEDGGIVMSQKDPVFWEEELDCPLIATLLGLNLEDLSHTPIQTVSTGTPKLIVQVSSLEALRRITPDLEGIIAYGKRTGNRGFYPFTSETLEAGSDFHARQFNPIFDLNEDPITGIAAGALGSYLAHHGLSPKKNFVIEQGYIIGKAGKIYVDLADGVKVGGNAVIVGTKQITLP